MQSRDNNTESDNDAQHRKTAEMPPIDPQELSQWASMKTAQKAQQFAYVPIELEALTQIQGFLAVHVMHIESGTLVQASPPEENEHNLREEPFHSIHSLANQRKFKSLALQSNDTMYIAGVIPSQAQFLYITTLRSAQANYALTKARLAQVFR